MQLTLTIPDETVGDLQAVFGNDLGRAALENFALGGYRDGELSWNQIQQLLGLESWYATQTWLGERGMNWKYTLEDLENDRQTMDKLMSDRQ